MELNSIITGGICVFLLIMNIVEKVQNSKREKELMDRVMASSLDDYALNKVRMSTEKPSYIGKIDEEEDEVLIPVD